MNDFFGNPLDSTSGDNGLACTTDPTVGPQTGGTYSLPDAAQPNNTPWDTPGGSSGQYGANVLDILNRGIGAWSQDQTQRNFIDYSRYEATNGGIFQQGYGAFPGVRGGVAVQAGGNGNMMLLILIAGAFFLLHKG